jgi:hypothetical protein
MRELIAFEGVKDVEAFFVLLVHVVFENIEVFGPDERLLLVTPLRDNDAGATTEITLRA